eukprot:TRINITY_DN6397_c0_g1_i4.p1 TRINITY_DN6397_c0_g1~~TRINITY_DN6397_c0_g1_i4.p1  ORF type:complete len:273 (-),score=89.35 TRINITY_DN6397_c0_g1_i4:53-871(-)
MAKVFPEVAQVFGKHDRGALVRPAFLVAFTSDLKESYKVVLEHLPQILPLLVPRNGNSPDDLKFKEAVMKQLKKWWQEENSWRDLTLLMDVVGQIQEYFPVTPHSNFYLDEFFKRLTQGNREVQTAAVKAICLLLVTNHTPSKREDALNKLNKLCTGNYYDRRKYLMFCSAAVECLAPSVLTGMKVYKQFIKLAEDRVANIRLGYVRTAMKIWVYAGDETVRGEIMGSLEKLREDSNNEVKNYASKACEYLANHKADIVKGCLLYTSPSPRD